MPQIHPRRTRRTLLATIGALAVSAAIGIASLASAADEPFKVGFVYVSPVGDAGWTFQHDSGRKEMEKLMKGMSKGKLPDLGALTGQAPAAVPQPGQRKATKSNKRKKRQKSRR